MVVRIARELISGTSPLSEVRNEDDVMLGGWLERSTRKASQYKAEISVGRRSNVDSFIFTAMRAVAVRCT